MHIFVYGDTTHYIILVKTTFSFCALYSFTIFRAVNFENESKNILILLQRYSYYYAYYFKLLTS